MIKNKTPVIVILFLIAHSLISYGQGSQLTNKNNSKTLKKNENMTKLRYDYKLNASPEKVWAIVGDLTGCSKWIPGITSAVMNGKNRTCTTADGQQIKEVIADYSDENRLFSYSQIQVPLPIKDSKGTFKVESDGNGSLIIWNVEFQLLDQTAKSRLIPMIDGYYKQTLAHLKSVVESETTMKEFMLFIQAKGNPVAALPIAQQEEHVRKVGAYIENLVKDGKMKTAQPLAMEGAIITGENGIFSDGPFIETKEVIAGYYHLIAKDLEEAIKIAKTDPRFEDGKWTIEIRPIMKVDGIN